MIGLAGKGSLLRITSGWARVVRSHRELVKPTEPRLWLSSGDVVILIQSEIDTTSFSCHVLTRLGEGWMHRSDLKNHQ
jgi:hypothetical protein